MTNHKQETIKRLEAAIKEAQFQIDELNKPKTHYPHLTKGFTVLGGDGKATGRVGDCHARNKVGNMFETKEKAERSNLYKILNSEYDYWFPGFSAKPDFEPNGLERWSVSNRKWVPGANKTEHFEDMVYRWKRSEN